ncbi:MAG: anthranilate phosphoribosyltransferase [Planctomycetota bacterium]|nr:anthranilate phosphoribosyltransferase [Planctomycetota bacterium]
MNLSNIVNELTTGVHLESEDMQTAVTAMMEGHVTEEQMADFLLALKKKGETVPELVGAARAMRGKMSRIRSEREFLVDTCGTGGDGSGTFNISTAAAIVAAACDVPIAKHGNRAVSSKSGSADALNTLGVNVAAPSETVERCLEQVGLCFCFAPLFHQSVKNVAAARKKLGVPTIFNMLGPLCNPAAADYQIIGVGQPWQRPLIAEALRQLGTRKSVVVHGTDGLCEISNSAETDVSIVSPDGIEETRWSPELFGCQRSSREEILAENPEKSVARIREALDGTPGGALDIVVLNAAAALWLTGKSQSLEACAEECLAQIQNGRAREKLQSLVECSVEPGA